MPQSVARCIVASPRAGASFLKGDGNVGAAQDGSEFRAQQQSPAPAHLVRVAWQPLVTVPYERVGAALADTIPVKRISVFPFALCGMFSLIELGEVIPALGAYLKGVRALATGAASVGGPTRSGKDLEP